MNINWAYEQRGDVPVAAGIPGASWCFDTQKVADRYVDVFAVPAGANSSIIQVHYKPQKSLSVVYRWGSEQHDDLVVSIDWLPQKARRKGLDGGTWIEDDRCLIHDFPADPGLPSVSVILQGHPMSVLSYRRGERCTLKSKATQSIHKVHSAAHLAHEKQSLLHAARPKHFIVPRPIASHPEFSSREEQFLTAAGFEASIDAERESVRIGVALAELHTFNIASDKLQNPAQLMRRMRSVALERIKKCNLDCFTECEETVALLEANAPDPLLSLLHGDLHTGNVLIAGEQIALIDLDDMTNGHPAYDLALLATRLLLLALCQPRNAASLVQLAISLPDSYRSSGGEGVSEHSFAWFAGALMISRQIKTCINNLAPDLNFKTNVLSRAAHTMADKRDFAAGAMIVMTAATANSAVPMAVAVVPIAVDAS